MIFPVLHRYITRSLIAACSLTSLIMLGVIFLFSMMGELKNIGSGDYGFTEAFWYTVLRLPTELYAFSPMLMLIGSMVGLSNLTTHHELTIMRASGFSVKKIVVSVIFAALILNMGVVTFGEVIAPTLSYQAEMGKENAKNSSQAVITASGIWLHIDNNFIQVQHVIGRQLLEGVRRYQFNNQHELQVVYFAKTLALENKEWQMYGVKRTTFKGDKISSDSFAKLTWDLKFNPNLLNLGLIEPNEMSLNKLSKFSSYLKQNGLQAVEYQYEFWRRIFLPFAGFLMVFLAVPFVLSSFRTTSLSIRIMLGVLLGFTFFILNSFLGQLSIVYQLPAFLAAFLPLLIFILFGSFLFKKIIKR